MADEVIQKTADYMKKRLSNDSSGHDWWHTYRVWQLGKKIAKAEKANSYTVELTCLLHDIADYKLHKGDEEIGPRLVGQWLESLSVDPKIISHVQEIILAMNFGGPKAENKTKTLEGQCVQDADWLDAIGAIGIARCFAFGGRKGNVIHDPSTPPDMEKSEDKYKKADATQINHFYEKLLLIKNRMNTGTGRRLAESKHQFIKQFLDQFLKEWELAVSPNLKF